VGKKVDIPIIYKELMKEFWERASESEDRITVEEARMVLSQRHKFKSIAKYILIDMHHLELIQLCSNQHIILKYSL
jgi:hypothetical protein